MMSAIFSGILNGFLLNPNAIFLLFVLAMMCIFWEISHPGAIFPGILGAFALLLFLFASVSFSPNWAGFALMLLAGVLLVLDVKLLTHGLLTLGAVLSLIVGTLLFFNTGEQHIQPIVVYSTGVIFGLISITLVTWIVRIQHKVVTTGIEGMVGSRVTAITPLLPEGRVRYQGENWAAIMDKAGASADPGSELRVVSVEGLRLRVRPLHASHTIVTQSTSTRSLPK